jgi:hypothetical protein
MARNNASKKTQVSTVPFQTPVVPLVPRVPCTAANNSADKTRSAENSGKQHAERSARSAVPHARDREPHSNHHLLESHGVRLIMHSGNIYSRAKSAALLLA